MLKNDLIKISWIAASYFATVGQVVCQPAYLIKADVKGLGDRSVVISYWRQLTYQTDTISVHQGRFTLTMMPTDGNTATLEISPSSKLTFWLEKPVVLLTGTIAPTPILKCTGTVENDLMETYRRTIERPFAARKRGKSSAEADPIVLEEYRQTRQFIQQHPGSLTSAYLLYWQAIYDTTIFDKLEKLLANLNPTIRNSYWAQKAVTRIYNVRHRPRVGQKLPTFSIPSSTGKLLSLDSLKGKYVLLDFWGTWCIPCIEGIPELKALHAKFKDRLTIVSIALERPSDQDKWLRMIAKYGMTWPQGIDLAGGKEGVNGLYNIWEYPTMLLADTQGTYLTKIKYGQPLEETVRQFIDK